MIASKQTQKITRLIVIGGDAAGMSAASKVRRVHPDWEITVYERSPHTSYAACGIPYYIGGTVESESKLIARSPQTFRDNQNIAAFVLHEVIQIDPKKKQVLVKNLETQQVAWDAYDYLLIATGAAPIVPSLPGLQSHGVFFLSSLQSGILAKSYIDHENPKSAVIVGGGYIGLEMAEALIERGIEVTLIDQNTQVMATLDPEMAALVSDFLRSAGVNVLLEERLEGIVSDAQNKVSHVATNKRKIKADVVILGIGVRPNTELAKEAGLRLSESGAIWVDDRHQTSEPDIWAAGDCACSYHSLKQKEVFISLGTVANKHGLVAGSVIAGEDAQFPGVLGTAITKFQNLEIARTGLSETEAMALGIPYIKATIESRTRAHYYPGTGKITVKLLCRAQDGTLVGGQIVGDTGSAKRIDTLVTAIMGNLTAKDLAMLDLSYAPPFSGVWDPLQIAARQLV